MKRSTICKLILISHPTRVEGTPVSSFNAWVGAILFYPKGDMGVISVRSNRDGGTSA